MEKEGSSDIPVSPLSPAPSSPSSQAQHISVYQQGQQKNHGGKPEQFTELRATKVVVEATKVWADL